MKVRALINTNLLTLFIIGPFYWFVGIPSSYLEVFKIILLLILFFLMFFDFLKNSKIISNPLVSVMLWSLLIILSTSLITLLIDYSDIGTYFIIQVIISFLFLLIGLKYGQSFFQTMGIMHKFGVFIFVFVIAVLFLISFLFSPSYLNNPFINNTYGSQLSMTGFGGGRTGWAVGFTFLSLFLIYLVSSPNKVSNLISIVLYLIICMFIIALPGGRSGILFFLVASLLFFRLASKSFVRYRYTIYLLTSTAAFFLFYYFLIYSESRLIDSFLNANNLNDLSSSRLDGYIVATQLIMERPFGYGFGKLDLERYNIYYDDVHNVWLNLSLKIGFIPVVVFLFAYLYVLVSLIRKTNTYDLLSLGLLCVLISGFYYSFFEPVSFLGNMQQTLIYWFSLGTLISINRKKHSMFSHNNRDSKLLTSYCK